MGSLKAKKKKKERKKRKIIVLSAEKKIALEFWEPFFFVLRTPAAIEISLPFIRLIFIFYYSAFISFLFI